jgi:hypothetical protein
MAQRQQVSVKFMQAAFATRQKFVDMPLLAGDTPLAALLSEVGVAAAKHAQWDAYDSELRPLSNRVLAALRDRGARNLIVQLRRRPSSKRPAVAVGGGAGVADMPAAAAKAPRVRAGAASAGAAARAGGAGASGAGAARGDAEAEEEEEPAEDEYRAEMWACSLSSTYFDEVGRDFPLVNALMELIDNAVRAVRLRAERAAAAAGGARAPPREVHVRLWQEGGAGGVWRLSVRDTGVGMTRKGVPEWARMHSNDGSRRQLEDGSWALAPEGEADNPFFPNGDLHFAGIGAKNGSLALCTQEGYVNVTTRAPVLEVPPGLSGAQAAAERRKDVCCLLLSRQICRERQTAALRLEALSPDARAAVLARDRDAPRSLFHFPGEVRAPRGAEVGGAGAPAAPDGGAWDTSGTLVEVTDLKPELVHLLNSSDELPKVLGTLAHTYHAYIHAHEPRGTDAGAAGAALALPMRIVVCGVDLATVTAHNLTRAMLPGAPGAPDAEPDTFHMALAVRRPSGEVAHASLRLYYHPFDRGVASMPMAALQAAGVQPAHVAVVRCGRALMRNARAATLLLAPLMPRYGHDKNQYTKARGVAASRLLARVTGVLGVGRASVPLHDKSGLREDTTLRTALAALLSSDSDASASAARASPQLAGASISMQLRYPAAAGGGEPVHSLWLKWSPVSGGDKLSMLARGAILRWVEGQHARDVEAGPEAPAGDFALALTVPNKDDCIRLRFSDAAGGAAGGSSSEIITGWRGIDLRGCKYVTNAPGAPLRLALTRRHAGRSGRPAALLLTVLCFVTLSGPDDEEARLSTGHAVCFEAGTPEARLPTLKPLHNAAAKPMRTSETREVLQLQLHLNGAVLVPISELVAASDEKLRVLDEEEWEKRVREQDSKKPTRIGSVPIWHGEGAGTDPLADACAAELPAEHQLPRLLRVALLRASAGRDGAPVTHAGVFVSEATRLTLTVTRLRADTAMEKADDDSEEEGDEEQLAALTEAPSQTLLQGRGVYAFDTSTHSLGCLRKPGTYRLTFSIAPAAAGAGPSVASGSAAPSAAGDAAHLAPLTLTLRRAAPPLRCVLDAAAEWSVCTHSGACCTGASQAATAGDDAEKRCAQQQLGAPLDVTLGEGGLLDTPLFLSQLGEDGAAVCFPPDAWRHINLSVWNTINDADEIAKGSDRRQGKLTTLKLAKVRQSDVQLRDGGRELVLSNVRLLPGALPDADELAADGGGSGGGRTPARGAPARGAPLHAMLRVGLHSARSEVDGEFNLLRGGSEVPITIRPGTAASIVVEPTLLAEWCAAAKARAGTLPPLTVCLVDTWGNPTAMLPRDAAHGQLAMAMTGLSRARSRVEAPADVAELKATGIHAGTAVLRLGVTARHGAPFSITLSAQGVKPLVLEGEVEKRVVRLLHDGAAAAGSAAAGSAAAGSAAAAAAAAATIVLSGPAGGALRGTVWAHVCAPGAAAAAGTPDEAFSGRLTLRAEGGDATWRAQVAATVMTAARGVAQLPQQLQLPLTPGAARISVHVDTASAAHVQLDVLPPPVARLQALTPDAPARAGAAGVLLEFQALAAGGEVVPVSAALLRALAVSGGDAADVKLVRAEASRCGKISLVTVALRGTPGSQLNVRLAAPPSADGNGSADVAMADADADKAAPAAPQALAVAWSVCLVAGPPKSPALALSTTGGGGAVLRADGTVDVACGGALPLLISFRDEDGAECDESATAGAEVTLLEEDEQEWLLCGAARAWPVRDGAAATEGLRVARNAPTGLHAVSLRLQLNPRTPLLDFELRLNILPGTHPAALRLALPGALTVEAGTPLRGLLGTVTLVDAAGRPVMMPAAADAACSSDAPPPALSALTLALMQEKDNARDPRTWQRRGETSWSVVAAAGADGAAVYDCEAGALASAPNGAGTYALHMRLQLPPADDVAYGGGSRRSSGRGGGGGAAAATVTMLTAARDVRVVPAARGPRGLRCAFLQPAQLPADVEEGALLTKRRDVSLTDAFGNPLGDAAPPPPPGALRLRFAPADPDAALMPLLLATAREGDARQDAAVTFTDVRAPTGVPSGRYVLIAEAIPGAAWMPHAGVVAAQLSFHFFSAAEGEETRERERAAERAAAAARAVAAANAAAAAAAAEVEKRAADAATATAAKGVAQHAAAHARGAADAARAAADAAEAHAQHGRGGAGAPPPRFARACPPHVTAYRQADVRAALHAGAVMCQLWELIRAETMDVSAALALALGAINLGMLLVASDAVAQLCRTTLPDCASLLPLHSIATQARFWRGGVRAGAQAPLALPDVSQVPGCLGHLVNLIHFSEDVLRLRVLHVAAGAAPASRRGSSGSSQQPPAFGPRAVLYALLGEDLLFNSDAAMHAHAAAAEARGEVPRGSLHSLSGARIGADGAHHGAAAHPRPFFAPPLAPWDEVMQVCVHACCRAVLLARALVLWL